MTIWYIIYFLFSFFFQSDENLGNLPANIVIITNILTQSDFGLCRPHDYSYFGHPIRSYDGGDKPGVCSLYWDNIVSTENIPTNHQFSLLECQACILYCERSQLKSLTPFFQELRMSLRPPKSWKMFGKKPFQNWRKLVPLKSSPLTLRESGPTTNMFQGIFSFWWSWMSFEKFRFWKHVFDQPGDQTEEAVNCIVKALKWRAEFGVDKLTEETINMSVVKKGSLYTHNRDKVRLISSPQ